MGQRARKGWVSTSKASRGQKFKERERKKKNKDCDIDPIRIDNKRHNNGTKKGGKETHTACIS
jgi:hypothetical protein